MNQKELINLHEELDRKKQEYQVMTRKKPSYHWRKYRTGNERMPRLFIYMNKYTIEVPLYGYNGERIERELSKIDNSPLKEAQKSL